MNNEQEEAVSTLLGWADEDRENRSVLVLADDESDTRLGCMGGGANLAKALANALLQEEKLRSVCATAMLIYKELETNDDDEAGAREAQGASN